MEIHKPALLKGYSRVEKILISKNIEYGGYS